MSTGQVLGAVGAVIGGYIGGPSGAQMGYAIGSGVGSLIDPEKVEGPRLDDLSTATAAYGAPLPEVWGDGVRVPGLVLWSAPLKERSEEVEAKGGPTQVVYKYYWSAVLGFAWADPRTAPQGYSIRKIWVNKKLIADYGRAITEADSTEVIENIDGYVATIGKVLEGAFASAKVQSFMEWHGGGADQQPPAVQEEAEGSDKTPGYKYIARLDIRDLPLSEDIGFGELGNRPPHIEVELLRNGTSAIGSAALLLDTTVTPATPGAPAMSELIRSVPHVTGWKLGYGGRIPNWRVGSWRESDGYIAAYYYYVGDKRRPISDQKWGGNMPLVRTRAESPLADPGYLWIGFPRGGASGFEPQNMPYIAYGGVLYLAWQLGGTYVFPMLAENGRRMVLASGTSPRVLMYTRRGPWSPVGVDDPDKFPGVTAVPMCLPSRIWQPADAAYTYDVVTDDYCAYILRRRSDFSVVVTRVAYGYDDASEPPEFAGEVELEIPAALELAISSANGRQACISVNQGNVFMLALTQAGALRVYRCRAAEGERQFSILADIGTWQRGLSEAVTTMYCDGRTALWNDDRGIWAATIEYTVGGGDTVDAVLRDLAIKSDLTPDDVDVSSLEGRSIHGFHAARRAPARSSVEQLMTYEPLTPVESGGKLVFRRRSAADPVIDIPADALLPGGEDGGDAEEITRTQDKDLPREVSISYASTDADYQLGMQSAKRLTSAATAQQTVGLAISMSDDRAAKTAARLLAQAYVERETYAFATDLTCADLEPGDVVRVPYGDRTLLARITTREDGDLEIRWQAKAEDPLVYQQYAVAADTGYESQEVGLAGASTLVLLGEIPPLRDSHKSPARYIAYDGVGGAWYGARMVRDGADVSGTAAGARAQLGYLGAPLGGHEAGSGVYDTRNALEIVFDADQAVELANISLAEAMQGKQLVVVDDEVIGIVRAELVGIGRYRCTCLLRGMRGSTISAHAALAAAVRVTEQSVRQLAYEAAEIGGTVEYRATSYGMAVQDTEISTVTLTGGTSRMLAPARVVAGRTAAGGLKLTWIRQGRLDQELRDFSEQKLDDALERYVVEICDASWQIKRTSELAAPEFDYTSAMQASDFGGAQNVLRVRVYQVSSTSGRGRPAVETINL